MRINELSTIDTLQNGDSLPLFDLSNGDTRKTSLSSLKSWLQENLSIQGTLEFSNQYSSPSSTDFSVQVTDGSQSIWLVLTPTAGFGAGTIVLPTVGNCINNQEILVNCTQSISTLTIDGNGATVTGEPSSISANGYFRLKFDSISNTWYRVG